MYATRGIVRHCTHLFNSVLSITFLRNGRNDFWQERDTQRHLQGRPRRPEPDRHSAAKTTHRPSLILTRFTRLLSQQVQSDSISKMPSPVKKPLLDSGAVLRFAKLSEHAMAPSKGEVHLHTIRTVVISSWTTKM